MSRGLKRAVAGVLLLVSVAGAVPIGRAIWHSAAEGRFRVSDGPTTIDAGPGQQVQLNPADADSEKPLTCTITPADAEGRDVTVPEDGKEAWRKPVWWSSGTATITCERAVVGQVTDQGAFTRAMVAVAAAIAVMAVLPWCFSALFARRRR